MSDLRHPCERWAEPISLATAGCLSPDEEREVRRHVATCSGCRERLGQLTRLCGALSEARMPSDAAEAAIVERVASAIASDASGRPQVRPHAEKTHATLRTRSLETWRWIMRSPVPRVFAAAVFLLAVTGVAFWFYGGGTTPAFADFIRPILEAKTARFKMRTEIEGPPAVTTSGVVMVLDAKRSRQEIEMVMRNGPETGSLPKGRMVMIVDWGQGKSLSLDTATKKAMVISLANLSEEQVARQDMFAWFRSILADARDKPDVEREPLGEKEIDGRRVVGYRVTSRGTVVSLWGDPDTGLPVYAEGTMALFPDAIITMSDFEFNVEMDESLFSLAPPAGYTVENMNVDASMPEEKDLVETFRIYTDLSGGAFPDSLDMQAMMQTVGKIIGMKNAVEMMWEKLAPETGKLDEAQRQKFEELMRKMMDWQFDPAGEKPNEDEMREIEEEMQEFKEQFRRLADLEKPAPGQEEPSEEEIRERRQAEVRKMSEAAVKKLLEVQVPLQRGLLFAFTLPPEADAHYAGKGVALGAADTPVFWYRPKDSNKYRVIYADLTIHDDATPPNVPDAQPVPRPAGVKQQSD